jgi:flagellar basal-body rod protein FlgG
MGTRPVATARIYSQGDFQQTGNPLDLVIQGQGFFQVRLPNGETGYTRDGTFHLNAQGSLVTADGNVLEPQLTIPPAAQNIVIGADGTVSVTLAGQNAAQQVGTIQLANFQNAGGLNPVGGNLFMATTASGDAITGTPGQNGLGSINQGFLEQSNVDIVKEMVNMIVAQRAYEVNSKAIKVADDMLSQINNLSR